MFVMSFAVVVVLSCGGVGVAEVVITGFSGVTIGSANALTVTGSSHCPSVLNSPYVESLFLHC